MLIRFVTSNFLSFGEEKEFNMIASSLKTHKHHVYKVGKIDILKSAAVYGANGAGKSNLIKAIEFLQEITENGGLLQSVNDKKFKLDKSFKNKPITFEIEISIAKKIYSYGISLDNNTILEEWLYESGITIDDKLIFERKFKNNKQTIKVAEKYSKTPKQKYLIELMEDSLLKNWESFLGKFDDLKIKEITAVRNHIAKSIVIIHPGSKFQGLVPHLSLSSRFKTFANDILKTFDTGVSSLNVVNVDFDKFFGEDDLQEVNEIKLEVENGHSVLYNSKGNNVLITKEDENLVVKKVVSNHTNNEGENITFELDEESDGTQRLLDFIPAFDGILEEEITFIIDEIDQSLHPALLRSLIKKIMTDDTTKGQLIFTTHESNLLDLEIFRQDEIWFAEKDQQFGNTHLYSLSEFKPRYDLDIRKGYLKGRFGAIPFLAQLEDLNWNLENA